MERSRSRARPSLRSRPTACGSTLLATLSACPRKYRSSASCAISRLGHTDADVGDLWTHEGCSNRCRKPKAGQNRIHLDLTTTSLDNQHESVSKLVELGARHIDIGQSPDEPHVVLADPEGNEFCVIEPDNSFLAGCGRLGALSCDGSREVGYFWSKALGWPLVWDQDEETAIRAPEGTGPFITWGGGPRIPRIGKNRLHLDIAPSEHGDQHVEVDRLVSLGATEVDIGQGPVGWVIMSDPDDNEFCVLNLPDDAPSSTSPDAG
jgi:Glyoxalase-like domain